MTARTRAERRGLAALLACGALVAVLAACTATPQPTTSRPSVIEPAHIAAPAPPPPRPGRKPAPPTAPVAAQASAAAPGAAVVASREPAAQEPAAGDTAAGDTAAGDTAGREPGTSAAFDRVIGLDQAGAEDLLGEPQQRAEAPPAKIWRYVSQDCEVEVYFYLDLQTQIMRALHYEVRSHDPGERRQDRCFDQLVAGRHARHEPGIGADRPR